MTKNPATTKHAPRDSLINAVGDFNGHSEQELDWRQGQFESMGFVTYLAEYLATTRIDLHQMRHLVVDQQCPTEFAMQIMMGTMWSGDDPMVQWTDEALEQLFEESVSAS